MWGRDQFHASKCKWSNHIAIFWSLDPYKWCFFPQWPIGFTTQGKFSWRSSKDNVPCFLQGITLGRLPPSISLGSLGGKNNKKQIDHDKTNTEIERQTKNGTCLSKNSDLWWISLNISLYFSLFPGTQMLGPCRIYYSWISFCNFCSKSPTAKLIEMDHDDPNAKIGLNW